MEDDYKQMLKDLNELKSRLSILDYFVDSFKEQDGETIAKLNSIAERLQQLEWRHAQEIKDIQRNIHSKIDGLEKNVSSIKESIDPVVNNSFLKVTQTMDMKKWILLITGTVSILTSAGVLDNAISDNISQEDVLNERLEQLIELAE